MANKPIHMSKLRTILKLHCQGHSKLNISTLTGLSRNTIKKYLHVFSALRSTWEELSLLSDQELDTLFNQEPVMVLDERFEKLQVFYKANERRLKQPGVTRLQLFNQYKVLHPEGFRQTTFYHHFNLWCRRSAPSMHMEHKLGDKLYVDFTGKKLEVVDPTSGEIQAMEVFVCILGGSQYTYVEAVESQRVEDFISCCENALHFYGGAPTAIVPDNLKSAVIKTNRYEPKLNENFEAFADHYSMAVVPARAYKPKDKSLVEGAVKIIYQRVFAQMPSDLPHSLEELNERIKVLLHEHNHQKFKGLAYSRWDQFNDGEQATLHALPIMRFELRSRVQVTVMKNGHVNLSIDKHYYSVPYGYIGKKVRILYSKSLVEIFFKYERIATHKRLRSTGNYTTDANHLASQHQVVGEWNVDYFLAQAAKISPQVEHYIAQVFIRKPHVEQAYRSCRGILSYATRVGHARLIKACERAHAYEQYSFKIIEEILNKGLDRYDTDDQETTVAMPKHENIRGKEYYQ